MKTKMKPKLAKQMKVWRRLKPQQLVELPLGLRLHYRVGML